MISQMTSIYAGEAIKSAIDKVEGYMKDCAALVKENIDVAYFSEQKNAAKEWLVELRDLHKRIVRQEV